MRRALLLFCLAGCTGTQGDVLTRLDLGGPVSPGAAPDAGFACQTGSVSGPCQAETAWEAVASKECQAAGLSLLSYTPSGPCALGYQGVSYVCCPAAIVMGCVQETQGSADAPVCQDQGQWKAAAAAACQASKFVLSGLSLLYPGGSCGAGFGGATWVCCPNG